VIGGNVRVCKSRNPDNNNQPYAAIPGDLEIYSGTCQNTGNTIPDTADIRIYGGSLIQKGGASNSGSGAHETFRDVTIYGGSYTMGADGTSSGSTTMRNATLFGGSMRQTRGHNLTMTGTLTLAGGTFTVNRYEKSSNKTLQSLQGGISITNTVSGAYIPMTFDEGSSETAPGAKSTLSVGITFTGNTTNDNTTVIDAKVPGEGIAFGQFLMNGDLAFDIGDGAADVDLLVRPQLVDNGTTAGSLAKRGSGTLAIANTNAFTGVTSVDAGRLIADGALAGDVTVAAGATFRGGDMGESGALAVGGNITFAQGAKLEFDPGAATTVAGDVVFGGVEMVLKDGAEITEDVLVMKARSFSGVVSGKFGKFVTRYRNGGTELWLGKDKGMVIFIR
jgi:autotransporter-associated beta strand protein